MQYITLALASLAATVGAANFSNQLNTPATGADPFVLKHEGVYYLYCTDDSWRTDIGIPVYTSTNLIDWVGPCGAGEHGLALHEDDVWGDTWFWGGDVIEKDGKFYMYATVEEHLIAAVSDSPLGPFTQAVQEPMHSTKEIDASVFTDDDGKHYIYYVRFEGGNVEYVAELSDDMLSMKEETITFCLRAEYGTWERGPNEPRASVLEGAYAVKHNNLYYLIYTANHFRSIDYSMGYATSTSPFGPWTRYSGNPILQATEYIHGPGNGMVVNSPDNSEMYLIYHTHYDLDAVWPRKVALDRAWFEADPQGGADIFRVNGPTVTPQPYPSGGLPAAPDAIAYWRFEKGTAGAEHATDLDDWYQDDSGNGNHLSSWWDQSRPMATTDRPFATVPQTGATNALTLDYDGSDDLGTFGNGGGKMLESYAFDKGWTIEASFKADTANWRVIVGKDGRPVPTAGDPPFVMKIRDDSKKLQIAFYDNSLNLQGLETIDPIALGEWHSVAATYDNTTFSLYLKGESDTGYVLQGSVSVIGGANLNPVAKTWTVGRGMWEGNPTDFFTGEIDEVRISNSPLDPSRFIGVAPPLPPEIGNIAMARLPGTNGLVITWNTAEGYSYALETKSSLDSGWAASTNLPGISGSISVTTSVEQAQSFYRIISE